MFSEVARGIQDAYGVDGMTAHRMASKNSPEAQRVWAEMQRGDHYVENLVNNVSHGRSSVTGVNAERKLDEFTNQHSAKVMDNSQQVVRQQAKGKMDLDGLEGKIYEQGQNVQNQYHNISEQNNSQYRAVKKHNEDEMQVANNGINKYEEDRIGKGRVGNVFGKYSSVGNSKRLLGDPNNTPDDK
jgi:hypothetical protein